MNKNKEIDVLQERIKELSCLYDVSTIANQFEKSFDQIVQEITERVSLAWCYPEDAICQIRIEDQEWTSAPIDTDTHRQLERIALNGQIIGSMCIHYRKDRRTANDFLQEERKLLKKLTDELRHLYEQKILKEREYTFERIAQRQDRIKILEEITAGIAHELNTPLGAILGFAQLIIDSTTDKQTANDATKIMNSALHAREIVKKLMYFSNEMPQQIGTYDLGPLILETVELLKPNLLAKNLEIKVELPESSILADVDSVQFAQVLFNLLINAIYASHPDTEILVELIDLNEKYSLQIHDYGTGIAPEIQERIFDPFFSTKPVGEGTGLGLSVCQGIIKSYGGKILVASQPNEGTTFHIELPKKQGI